MNKSLLYFSAICSLLFALSSTANQPNVLFIAVDDMNDWIGCLDTTPKAITPNIDRLAFQGVNFTNAHTAGVYCAPSRAAIFTGRHASTTGCYQTSIYYVEHPNITPLQSSFQNSGYKTMGAGKLFHHPAGAIDLRGWDEFFVRTKAQRETGYPLDSWKHGVPLPNPLPNSIYNRTGEPAPASFMEWAPLANDQEENMADTIRANWAVTKLQEDHEKPFFLGVGCYAPHFPNYCPQKYFDLYDPNNIELPPYKTDDLEDLPDKIRKIKTNRSRIHKRLESIDAVDDAIHGYLASISYADAMIGRVLDALESSPYADNTLVVLWSDHGYHHGEKGDWGKHTLWERTSNVPFIWKGAGIAEGKTTDTTVSLIDMYPTFVDLCQLAPVEGLEGVSIANTLKDPTSAKDRNVFLPGMEPNAYAIINKTYRYIHYADGGEELYQVQSDPNEWYNIADDPQFVSVKATLQNAAPKTFAEPGKKLNARRNLIIEGETYHWKQ